MRSIDVCRIDQEPFDRQDICTVRWLLFFSLLRRPAIQTVYGRAIPIVLYSVLSIPKDICPFKESVFEAKGNKRSERNDG